MNLFMDSLSVKDKRMTTNEPGSQSYTTTKNSRTLLKTTFASCDIEGSRKVKVCADVDIHKAIGRFPKPKGAWTPGNYNY